jgi:hypothetical protein
MIEKEAERFSTPLVDNGADIFALNNDARQTPPD